jgi:hypothetical protein
MNKRLVSESLVDAVSGRDGRETADGFDGTERLDAAVEELRWYTSVLSERASASSMSTPR